MKKQRYRIEETTRDEREKGVRLVLEEMRDADPQFNEIAAVLYQLYVDGKLEIEDIDQLMDVLNLLVESDKMTPHNVKLIGEALARRMKETDSTGMLS